MKAASRVELSAAQWGLLKADWWAALWAALKGVMTAARRGRTLAELTVALSVDMKVGCWDTKSAVQRAASKVGVLELRKVGPMAALKVQMRAARSVDLTAVEKAYPMAGKTDCHSAVRSAVTMAARMVVD